MLLRCRNTSCTMMYAVQYDVECANKANYHVKKVCTINDTVKQNQMIWGNCTQQIRGFGVVDEFFYPTPYPACTCVR